MSTYSELRARARESLRGNWGKAIGGLVLVILLSFVIGLLGVIPIFGYVLQLLTNGAIALGLYIFYLEIARGENPSVSTVFSGFNFFFKAFLLYLLMAIFTLLWTLLLIIPGIIAAFRYSQAYFILKDHPEISALEAIRRSKELMVGQKWRLFVLNLTFIGWALLAILTFGIGYLWLSPYITVTQAHFYDEISGRSITPA